MRTADSLGKTLILWNIESRRRRGQQRMRWLDGVTDSMDTNLGKLQEMVSDRSLACCSPQGHKESDTTWWLNNNIRHRRLRGRTKISKGRRRTAWKSSHGGKATFQWSHSLLSDLQRRRSYLGRLHNFSLIHWKSLMSKHLVCIRATHLLHWRPCATLLGG